MYDTLVGRKRCDFEKELVGSMTYPVVRVFQGLKRTFTGLGYLRYRKTALKAEKAFEDTETNIFIVRSDFGGISSTR